MDKENNKQDNLKIIFSLISLLMMLPPLMSGDSTNYYRALFIFLINRVIDMFFEKKEGENNFFIVWSLVNQWAGVIACALAFASIEPQFAAICASHSGLINSGLLVAAISCVLKEMVVLIVQSVKEQLVKERIQKEVSQMEGQ